MAYEYTGIVTADLLHDTLFQNYIISDVLIQAQGYGNLNHEAIVRRWRIPGTYATIPSMSAVQVTTDLAELESSDAKSPDFAGINVQLKADEVKVAFSDESMMNQNIANPMELTRIDSAIGFARALDNKIATALDTTPQAGTAWNPASSSFLSVAAEAVGLFGNYRISGIAAGVQAHGEIMSNLFAGATRTNMAEIRDGLTYLPGYNVPIITSTSLPQDAIYFVSREVPGVYVLEGEYKTRVYDDPKTRSTIMQSDIYNAVVGNIRQTAGDLNQGVVKVELA